MSDAQLRMDILAWLRDYAQGSRDELLRAMCALGHWPSPDSRAESALRRFLKTMPEAASMFERKRQIEKSAPCGQGELW